MPPSLPETAALPRYAALLYSIVLAPQRRVVMTELRAMAEDLGFETPSTLLSTGNLLFTTGKRRVAQIEAMLEEGFRERFGRQVDIIVRRAEDMLALDAANPFPAESVAEGDRVAVRVMREPLAVDSAAGLGRYLAEGDVLRVVGGDLWVYLPNRLGTSKLVGALTPKRHGIGTMRNANTVRRIAEAIRAERS